MIQICYVCWKIYGEKKPLNDKSETHGICDACWPGEIAKIKRQTKQTNPETQAPHDDEEPPTKK